MRKIIANIFLVLLPLLVVYLYYNFYATSGNLWSVQCTFHDLTGWQCPGCGGQRAFYYLLQGDFLLALRHNLLIVILLPLLLYCYIMIGQIYLAGSKGFDRYLRLKPWHAYLLLIVLALFFILRNVPFFPFTLLSPPC